MSINKLFRYVEAKQQKWLKELNANEFKLQKYRTLVYFIVIKKILDRWLDTVLIEIRLRKKYVVLKPLSDNCLS